MSAPVRVGLVGCGNVAPAYARNAGRFGTWELAAVADAVPVRAEAFADRHPGCLAVTPADLLASSEVDVVLNLTPPESHAEVTARALDAGKHVYTEKPLALNAADGERLVHLAAARGVRLGCAPDTFLGAGWRTAERILRAGVIGPARAIGAFMAYAGPNEWHPDPEFLFRPGAGPLWDMGPYYLTCATRLMGPISRVTAMAQMSEAERCIKSGPRAGVRFTVGTPTHISASAAFASGGMLTMIMSFETPAHSLPCMEIYGAAGSLSLPDPNAFGGPVRIRRAGEPDWRDVPLGEGEIDNARGIGLHDMVESIRAGRPHQASGEAALHVLRCMEGMLDSARTGRAIEIDP